MKEVNMYLQTSCKGIMQKEAYYISLLEYVTTKGNVTKYWLKKVENETKYRVELKGAIKALQALKEPCYLNIFTDSIFLAAAVNEQWLDDWKNNEWKNAKGEEVKNADLWVEFYRLLQSHTFRIITSTEHEYAIWQKTELEKSEK